MVSQKKYNIFDEKYQFNKTINSADFKLLDKKRLTLSYASLFRRAGLEKQSRAVYYCSTSAATDDNYKFKCLSCCRTRLCPLCSWRLAVKTFHCALKASQIMTGQYIFITLTCRNCSADELSATIDLLLSGYKKFYSLKRVKAFVLGTFRSLEVTYNFRTNTYHPHLHILVNVSDEYYQSSNQYIDNFNLSKLWKQCLQVDYMPVTYVEKVQSDSFARAVAEVSKYCVKGADIMAAPYNIRHIVLADLFNSLSGRRLLSWSGTFARAKRQLKLDENNISRDDIDAEISHVFRFLYEQNYYFEVTNYFEQ